MVKTRMNSAVDAAPTLAGRSRISWKNDGEFVDGKLVAQEVATVICETNSARSDRERIEKASEYERFGVRNYWLVDPELQSVEVFELGDGRYVHALPAADGQVDRVPGCTGLVLELDALWTEVDRLHKLGEES